MREYRGLWELRNDLSGSLAVGDASWMRWQSELSWEDKEELARPFHHVGKATKDSGQAWPCTSSQRSLAFSF